MKIAIVGLGGIGSHLARFIAENNVIKGIDGLDNEYVAIDFDKVEEKNLRYTTFTPNDLEKSKTKVISDRFGLSYLTTKINKENYQKILKDFSIVVMCVDNSEVRRLVSQIGKPIIDIRAKGSAIAIYQLVDFKDDKFIENYLNTLNTKEDTDSCQYEIDLNSGFVQFGMLIASSIGFQLMVSLTRDLVREKELKNKSFVWSF